LKVSPCWLDSQSGKGSLSAKGPGLPVEHALSAELLGALGFSDADGGFLLELGGVESFELGLLGLGIGVDHLKALDPELHIREPRRRVLARLGSGLVHDDALGQGHHRRLVVGVEVLRPVAGDVGDAAPHLDRAALGSNRHGLLGLRCWLLVVVVRSWGGDVGGAGLRLLLDGAVLSIGLPQPLRVGQDLTDRALVHQSSSQGRRSSHAGWTWLRVSAAYLVFGLL
jgi:hypothetical protein